MPDDLGKWLAGAAYEGLTFPVVDAVKLSSGHSKVMHGRYKGKGVVNDSTGQEPRVTTLKIALLNSFPNWPKDLFPSRMQELLEAFESTPIGTLNHPLYGNMQVHVDHWDVTIDTKTRNGCFIDAAFTEESSEASLLGGGDGGTNTVQTDPATDTKQKSKDLDTALIDAGFATSPFFATAAAELVAYLGAENRSPLEASAAFQDLYTTLSTGITRVEFAAVDAHPVREAIVALRSSLHRYQDAYSGDSSPTQYIVPVTMSLSRIAAEVYGDASKAPLLLRQNTVPNALFVPEGTVLLVPAL